MKFFDAYNNASPEEVAPYAGAWIEIVKQGYVTADTPVAPYAGAWIEISITASSSARFKTSHPTRVRGLKYSQMVGRGTRL